AIEIVRLHLPHIGAPLAGDVARAADALRAHPLRKPPGIAESLDWAQTLALLGAERLDDAVFEPSLGSVLKYPEDLDVARGAARAVIAAARAEGAA
ncbi:MAG: MoxR family ATPase, partial [Candidatus Velthaea sp.]